MIAEQVGACHQFLANNVLTTANLLSARGPYVQEAYSIRAELCIDCEYFDFG